MKDHEKTRGIKTWLSLFLATLMVFTMLPTVSLAASDDITNHWAEDTMRTWIDLGMFNGDGRGSYYPDDNITRAEFMTLVNSYKGYTARSSDVIKYTDVAAYKWYYGEVAIALAAGYVIGTSPTTMCPEMPITRQEAMIIIARVAGLYSTATDLSVLATVNDSSMISDWARSSVATTIAHGLVAGNAGNINPLSNITRAETVVLIDRARTDTRTYAFEGTYSISSKNAIIAMSNVTLVNATIFGDLTISAAVGSGEVYIDNVTVNGKLYVEGGGMSSIYIKDSKLDEVSITKNEVSVVFQGGTTAARASIIGTGSSIQIASNATIGSVVTTADADGALISIDSGAKVSDVEINAPNATLNMATNSTVTTLSITKTGTDASIIMASGSKITTANISAATDISGKGTITTANVKAKGVVIETKPGTTKVDSGIHAKIAGKDVTGTITGGGDDGGGGHIIPPVIPPVTPSVQVSSIHTIDKNNFKVVMADDTLAKEAFTVKLTSNNATTIAVSSAVYTPVAGQTPGYYSLALGSSLTANTAYTVTVSKSGYISHVKNDVKWVEEGTISGIITAKQADDGTSTATGLVGATVTIKENTTDVKTGSTVAAGAYSIAGVPVGTYTIEATATGYKTKAIPAQSLTTAGLVSQNITLASTATKLYSSNAEVAITDNTAKKVVVLNDKFPSELNAVLTVQHGGTVKIYNIANADITSVSATTTLVGTDYIVVTAEDRETKTTYTIVSVGADDLLKAAVQAVMFTTPATANKVKLAGTTSGMKYYVTDAGNLPGSVNAGTLCDATATEIAAVAGQVITVYIGSGNANEAGNFKRLTVALVNIGPVAAPSTTIAFAASSTVAGQTLVTLNQGNDGISPTLIEYYVAANGESPTADAVWSIYTAAFETAATAATKVYLRVSATALLPASKMTNGGIAVALTEIKAAAAPTSAVFTVSSAGGTTAGRTALVPAGTDSANAASYQYVIVAHGALTSTRTWVDCAATMDDLTIVAGETDDVYLRVKATTTLPASDEVKALDAIVITPAVPDTKITLSKGTNAGTTKITLVIGDDNVAITKLEYLVAADTTGTPTWTTVTAASINNVAVSSGAHKVFLRVKAAGSTPASAATTGIVVTVANIQTLAAPTSAVFTVSSTSATTTGKTALVPAGTDSANAASYQYVIVAHGEPTSTRTWVDCAATMDDLAIVAGATDDVYLRVKATTTLPASEQVKALDAIVITQ